MVDESGRYEADEEAAADVDREQTDREHTDAACFNDVVKPVARCGSDCAAETDRHCGFLDWRSHQPVLVVEGGLHRRAPKEYVLGRLRRSGC